MLIRNPSEYEHVAREWAIKYAGAPKKEIAEGSGGATAESLRKKTQDAKAKEAKVALAAYVVLLLQYLTPTDKNLGTTATTRIL